MPIEDERNGEAVAALSMMAGGGSEPASRATDEVNEGRVDLDALEWRPARERPDASAVRGVNAREQGTHAYGVEISARVAVTAHDAADARRQVRRMRDQGSCAHGSMRSESTRTDHIVERIPGARSQDKGLTKCLRNIKEWLGGMSRTSKNAGA